MGINNFNIYFKKIYKNIYEDESLIKIFGIFSIFNFPIFYLVWNYINHASYDHFALRFFAFLLCFPLIFVKKWPHSFKKFLPIYWYFTLLYCIPFFITYMFIVNQASIIWSTNAMIGIIWLILVVDWLSFFFLIVTGILIACSVYHNLHAQLTIDSPNLVVDIINYIFIIVTSAVFSRHHQKITQEKMSILKSSAGAIAHEMRTPLATILMSSDIIKSSVSEIERFVSSPSKDEKIVLRTEINQIKTLCERLSRITKASQNLINLLLANIKQDFYTLPHTKLSLQTSLDYILDEFAFKPDERVKVHLKIENDFEFYGNLELMMHVFFNLLKNSLYFIRAANKGEIFIHALQSNRENIIVFKDTGPGIEVHQLAHIFKPFYSKRPHGTGIGLSFCKKAIESMKGKIDVQSVFGVHTTFTLRLPKINAILNEIE